MSLAPHWRYFLSLERDFIDTLRYVEYNDSQKDVYSFEYARLLLMCCAELDVVFKISSENVSSGSQAESIGTYLDALSSKYDIQQEEVRVDRFSKVLYPYRDWSRASAPQWWTAHNHVKHHRHKYFAEATAQNTLLALSGLFVANLIAHHAVKELGEINEYPLLLSREHGNSGVLSLSSDYELKLR